MTKKILCGAAFVLAVFGLSSFGQQQKELPLSLDDAIVRSLKNNLNVAVQVVNPQLSSAQLSQAKQFYMPTLAFAFTGNQFAEPATWSLQNSGTYIQKYTDSNVGITQQIPFGGSLTASLDYLWTENNQLFQNFNPTFQSTVSFTLTQPLLRNFGWRVSRKQIIIAQNNLDISRSQFKSTLITTVFNVEQAYWNLVYSIENLKTQQQSLDLGRDLLTKTKKEVEVGQKAPIEVLNAETTVARREADILSAEAAVRINRDQLRVLLNLDADPPAKGMIIVPSDQPVFKAFHITYEEALQRALARRPELDVIRSGIETSKLNLTVARNQLLPQLDLKFTKTSPGITGDQLLYQDNNPLTGIVVGTIPGQPSQAFKDAFSFLYNNWTVGLTLTIPFADMVGRANYAYAKLGLEQGQASLKNEEQQISLDVSNAVLNLETTAKAVDAYRVARELAEKQLEAEMKKLNVGMSTNYFVLQYQNDLATARSLELQALVNYNIALAQIAQVTGTTLEDRNISLTDYIK